MHRAKRVVRALAGGWLAVQLSAFAAVPVGLCLLPAPVAAAADADCCPNAGPGHVCPMRHSPAGARTCRVVRACGAADAALLSLSGGVVGVPIAPAGASRPLAASGLVPPSTAAPVARPAFPEPPPPRA